MTNDWRGVRRVLQIRANESVWNVDIIETYIWDLLPQTCPIMAWRHLLQIYQSKSHYRSSRDFPFIHSCCNEHQEYNCSESACHFEDAFRASGQDQPILLKGVFRTFSQMATEEWTEHHTAFALLSAEKCTDKTILEGAARKITHNIDAFDKVRQVV